MMHYNLANCYYELHKFQVP